jgi:hypothetical protein
MGKEEWIYYIIEGGFILVHKDDVILLLFVTGHFVLAGIFVGQFYLINRFLSHGSSLRYFSSDFVGNNNHQHQLIFIALQCLMHSAASA